MRPALAVADTAPGPTGQLAPGMRTTTAPARAAVAGACSSGAPWMIPIELPDVDLWLAGTQADVKHLLKPPAVEEIVATSL